jgi:hypothetical protein
LKKRQSVFLFLPQNETLGGPSGLLLPLSGCRKGRALLSEKPIFADHSIAQPIVYLAATT